MSDKLRVILTGATGMVGEGVLHECLLHPDVEQVLVINRKPCGVQHPRLREIIHKDFFDITSIEPQLAGYNTCFFCLGVSSIGMKEEEYHRLTYTLTLHFAAALARQNKDLQFFYISGARTDSSEKGRSMWARVKGQTENSLMKLPFKKAYAVRPGFMKPTKGLKNTLSSYKYMSWLYPVLKWIAPRSATTLKEVGLAMINAALNGYDKQVLEISDILRLAKQ